MLILTRLTSDLISTKGVLRYERKIICYTLELPWRNNERNISCLKQGSYKCWKANSPKFGNVVYVDTLPSRIGILFHRGNTVQDTRGCILTGLDIVNDKLIHSRIALDRLLDTVPEKFELQIREVF